MEISAPTGGASGYLQAHLASAGRVGRGRRAGGGDLTFGRDTHSALQSGGNHALAIAHGGVKTPLAPSLKGPTSEILPAGIGAIIRTLHNCDRCFFYGLDPALTALYPE